MNKNELRYIISDAIIGLKRNKGGTFASILFVALSMSFIGLFLLVRVVVGDATDYISTQLSMKVYLEQQVSTSEVAAILEDKDFVASVEVEKGEDLVKKLSFFFDKRSYLLDAFKDGQINDAIRLKLKNPDNMDEVANALNKVDGIEKVVYPQEMAKILQSALSKMTLYGLIITVVLLVITFLMIYTTLHLALYRRQKELKVKLLVGMNPTVLRCQFLFEGLGIAVIGALISTIFTILVYRFFFASIQQVFVFLTPINTNDLMICLMIEIAAGVFMSLFASFLATRKWIKHA